MTVPHIFPAVSERDLGQAQGSDAFWLLLWIFALGKFQWSWRNKGGLAAQAATTCGHGNMAGTLIFLVFSLIFQSNVVILSISKHSCKNVSLSTMIKQSGVLTHAAVRQADLKKILCSQTTGSRQFLLKHVENLPWYQQKKKQKMCPQSPSTVWGFHSNYTWHRHKYAAIWSTSYLHRARSLGSLIFWV